MRNFTVLLLSLLLFISLSTVAQEFSILSFKNDALSQSAWRNGRIDKDKNPCALVKVVTRIEGVKFECPMGITGDVVYKTGETWLYISPAEKKIRFTKEGFVPKDFLFPLPIEGGLVYILEVDSRLVSSESATNQPDPAPGSSLPQLPDTTAATAPVKTTARKGALYISTNPRGVSILIDSILQPAKTPLLIEQLPEGIHQVNLEKPGYSEVVKKILIKAGKTTEMNEILPSPILLTVISIPSQASLVVDGIDYGLTPAKISLLKGSHFLKLSADGHYTVKQNLNLTDSLSIDTIRMIPVINFEMVLVEGGTFNMGSDAGNEEEKPVHQVTLDNFYLGKFEVTQQQWTELMGKNPSKFNTCKYCPVESVSWNDIQEFLQRLNELSEKGYRLPTEAEWEYAARGGNKSKGFTLSGSNNADEVAWTGSNAGSKVHPVGEKMANELGIYDMSGNVWEWCSDLYDETYYGRSPARNPKGSNIGREHILRGGSWLSGSINCQVTHREWELPDQVNDLNGFRLALDE